MERVHQTNVNCSPHTHNRVEVSVGKDSQLLFKMSPCLLDTPIACNHLAEGTTK